MLVCFLSDNDLNDTEVDLKYLTSTQVIEVVYEGKTRRFELHSVSTQHSDAPDSVAALAADLDNLGLHSTPQLWTVGWDSFVTVVDNGKEPTEEKVKVALWPSNATNLSIP